MRIFAFIALAVIGLGVSPVAQGAIIHESATLGAYGLGGGPPIDPRQYLGSRFSVDSIVEVESVGGHFWTSGVGVPSIFASIVSLSSPTALPSGDRFEMTTPLATTQFIAPPGHSDILIPLSVRLEPGHYGLIFWAEGLNAGNMPGHDIDIPGRASYFSYLDNFPPFRGWIDGPYTGLRFVVTGRVIPEPATWVLAALAAMLLGIRRLKSPTMPYLFLAALAIFVFAPTPPARAEILDGHTVRTTFYYPQPHGLPTEKTVVDSVVGPGTELMDPQREIGVDFSDTNILITKLVDQRKVTFTVGFEDVYGTIPRFTDVAVNPATTWKGFPPYPVSFDANGIYVPTLGLIGSKGEQISLDITAIIPEPATWVIAAVATAFLTFRTRQQRRMLLISAVLVIVVLDPMPSTQASTISTFPAFAARTEDRIRNSIYTIGQTFTVTPGTESLSSFTFYLRLDPSRTGPYPFRLWELDDNGDFQSLIFSGLTTSTPFIEPPRPGGSTDFIQVTMQTGTLPLTPSRSYLAALIADSLDMREWGDVGDLYPDGGSYHFKTRDSVLSKSNIDLAFTAEFVGGEDRIYGTIPEPASRAMLCLALLAVGGCARRRISRGVTQSPSTSPRSPPLNSTIVLRAPP